MAYTRRKTAYRRKAPYRARKPTLRAKKSYRKHKAISKITRFRNMMVRSVQKKEITAYIGSAVQVGQVSTNSSGDYVIDCTPITTQGSAFGNRIGDEIWVTGMRFKFQFWGQSGNNHGGIVKFIFFGVRQPSNAGSTTNISAVFHNAYDPNPFALQASGGTSIWDTTAELDPRANRAYFIPIRTVTKRLYPTQYAGQTVPQEFNIGLKFKKPWKVSYFPGANTFAGVDQGQIGCAVVCDCGNAGGANNTNLVAVIPITANSTGWNFNFSQYAYFVDAVM